MTKPLFITSLVLPQGNVCQFKVYGNGKNLWEFISENLGLTIILSQVHKRDYQGSLIPSPGNKVQAENLICQAIFVLEEFYRQGS